MAEVVLLEDFWREKGFFGSKLPTSATLRSSDMKNTFSRKQDNNGLKEEASSTSERKARSPKLCREHELFYIQK